MSCACVRVGDPRVDASVHALLYVWRWLSQDTQSGDDPINASVRRVGTVVRKKIG